MYIIMEYGPYGDLKKILDRDGPFSEKKAAWMIKRIATALQYMHRQHILHRDIKAENILIGEGVGVSMVE